MALGLPAHGQGSAGSRDAPFPLASPCGEKAEQGQEQRSRGPRIYSVSCQSVFGSLKNNHNSWVKNESVTRHQPQSEPPQGEIGVPDGASQALAVALLTL